MKILFASNKGGVGKTTTAVNLAIYQQAKGKSVVMIKADKNNDLFDFQKSRQDLGADMPIIQAFGDISGEIKRASQRFDIVIVDCAGHDSTEFRSALQVCDVYLCLIKPSSEFETGTLVSITSTVRNAQSFNPELKPLVVMARMNNRRLTAAVELESELKSDPVWIQPAKTRISELTIFETACNSGVGVHEIKTGSSLGKAKAQIELLASEIGL